MALDRMVNWGKRYRKRGRPQDVPLGQAANNIPDAAALAGASTAYHKGQSDRQQSTPIADEFTQQRAPLVEGVPQRGFNNTGSHQENGPQTKNEETTDFRLPIQQADTSPENLLPVSADAGQSVTRKAVPSSSVSEHTEVLQENEIGRPADGSNVLETRHPVGAMDSERVMDNHWERSRSGKRPTSSSPSKRRPSQYIETGRENAPISAPDLSITLRKIYQHALDSANAVPLPILADSSGGIQMANNNEVIQATKNLITRLAEKAADSGGKFTALRARHEQRAEDLRMAELDSQNSEKARRAARSDLDQMIVERNSLMTAKHRLNTELQDTQAELKRATQVTDTLREHCNKDKEALIATRRERDEARKESEKLRVELQTARDDRSAAQNEAAKVQKESFQQLRQLNDCQTKCNAAEDYSQKKDRQYDQLLAEKKRLEEEQEGKVVAKEQELRRHYAPMMKEYDMARVTLQSQVHSHANEKDEMKQRFAEEKRTLEQEVRKESARAVGDLKTSNTQLVQENDQLRNDHKDELDRAKREGEDRVQRLNIDHEGAMATMRSEQNSEIIRLKGQHEAEVASVTSAYESKNTELASGLREAKRNAEDKITRIQRECNVKLEKERTAFKGKELQLQKKHRQEIQDILSDNEALKGALVDRDHFHGMADSDIANRFEELKIQVDQLSRVQWDKGTERTWPYPETAFPSVGNVRKWRHNIVSNSIWVILDRTIFCSPFKIFGTEGDDLNRKWLGEFKTSRTASQNAYWPEPTQKSEKWRHETIQQCLKALGHQAEAPEEEHNQRRAYEQSLNAAIDYIARAIGYVAVVRESEQSRIGQIVHLAVKFWLDVGLQRFRIIVLIPSTSDNLLEGRRGHKAMQELIVRPGLRRIGNSEGEELDSEETIAGCEPGNSMFRPR